MSTERATPCNNFVVFSSLVAMKFIAGSVLSHRARPACMRYQWIDKLRPDVLGQFQLEFVT